MDEVGSSLGKSGLKYRRTVGQVTSVDEVGSSLGMSG